MKFSLCIEPVFTSVPLIDRIALAKECGADAVEFWDPSAVDAAAFGAEAARLGMPIACCCLNQNWVYRLNQPAEVVLKNLVVTLEYGKQLGCNTFIGLAGDLAGHGDTQKLALTENLKRMAEVCEREGATIILEALNSMYDHKGYYLDSSYVGFEIMRAVGSPRVKLLFDCYHMQLMEGNLVNNIRDNIGFIGHFHSAGAPGRHEHMAGETHYPRVLAAAGQAGYTGYFGLEYWPTYEDAQSVRDVLAHLRGQ